VLRRLQARSTAKGGSRYIERRSTRAMATWACVGPGSDEHNDGNPGCFLRTAWYLALVA
jgi:hypothetical protein